MVRLLLTPQNTDLHISLPPDYVGKKVEVLVFACDEATEGVPDAVPRIMEQFWSVISDETTNAMHKHIAQSREEWERDI